MKQIILVFFFKKCTTMHISNIQINRRLLLNIQITNNNKHKYIYIAIEVQEDNTQNQVFSHIYIIIISTIFSVPAQWSQWSKHTWFWSSRVRTPPGARLDKLQILEKFQIQTNFRFRQILDKKIGYHHRTAAPSTPKCTSK